MAAQAHEDAGEDVENSLGGIGDEPLDEAEEEWAISVTGTGWIERKKTGGTALYWYQRWREKPIGGIGGKPIKRSKYLAPYKGNEELKNVKRNK